MGGLNLHTLCTQHTPPPATSAAPVPSRGVPWREGSHDTAGLFTRVTSSGHARVTCASGLQQPCRSSTDWNPGKRLTLPANLPRRGTALSWAPEAP